jgi:hypothetical protein
VVVFGVELALEELADEGDGAAGGFDAGDVADQDLAEAGGEAGAKSRT